jgi:hypothetical protein
MSGRKRATPWFIDPGFVEHQPKLVRLECWERRPRMIGLQEYLGPHDPREHCGWCGWHVGTHWHPFCPTRRHIWQLKITGMDADRDERFWRRYAGYED